MADVHYLDPRRPAGLDNRRGVTQWPVICAVDVVEVPIETLEIAVVTERRKRVTCTDCKGRIGNVGLYPVGT